MLIEHLLSETISIPQLQYEMNIPYKDARSLVEYAICHKWVSEHVSGNEYHIIVSKFTRKELAEDISQKIFTKLNYDDIKVLDYIGSCFVVSYKDILNDVDNDEETVLSALNKLVYMKLIFKHEHWYYCRITKRSIKLIKKNLKKRKKNGPLNFNKLLEGTE